MNLLKELAVCTHSKALLQGARTRIGQLTKELTRSQSFESITRLENSLNLLKKLQAILQCDN